MQREAATTVILRVLAVGPLTPTQLARTTGLGKGAVVYALRQLIEAGAVEPLGGGLHARTGKP